MQSFEPVPTRAALLKQSDPTFNVVVFESKKKRPAQGHKQLNLFKEPDSATKGKQQGAPIDFKKAQKEVVKFGVDGISDKLQKNEAEIALAIKLGARAPKKSYRNYKSILGDKQKEKQQALAGTPDRNRVAKKYQSGATQSYQKVVQRTKNKKKQPKNVLEAYGKVDKKKIGKMKGVKKVGKRSKK